MFFYSDDGTTFGNKFAAQDYKEKTRQQIYFYYHDDVYKNINWTIEPPDSLDTLYKQQAQRIRDEYDYVILCYSGGYDSTNILETFFYNNIKLDKIVVTGPFSRDTTTDQDQNHNGEIYNNAFPYLKELGLDSIVQTIDYTDVYGTPEKLSIFSYGDDWAKYIGARQSPHHFFWRDLEKYVVPKEYQDKKIAIIWGTDKPVLKEDNKTYELYFEFPDIVITSYGRQDQIFNSNVTNINFYWDPSAPFILIKQLHIIKKFFQSHEDNLPLKNTTLVNLIYNFKKPLLYKSGKSLDVHLGKRDKFLLNKQDSKIYKFYLQGLKKISKYDLRGIYSKKYIIYKP